MNTLIPSRLTALRTVLKNQGISAFIIPSTDPHLSEYVAPHWHSREWVSGFSGSAGTAVVTLEKAGLWTDSRYFLQAADQLQGTGIDLYKEMLPETPSIAQFLTAELKAGESVGIDAAVFSTRGALALSEELAAAGIALKYIADPLATIWSDRPAIPQDPIVVHPLRYAGKAATEKLSDIRQALAAKGAEALFVSLLDEIAWTLNLRGSDVHCNPVFVAYLYIGKEETILFTDAGKVPQATADYLTSIHVSVAPYSEAATMLSQLQGVKLQLDLPKTNAAIYHAARQGCTIIDSASPICLMKSVKNEVEQEGFREAMIRDGVAMVKFLRWLKPAVEQGGQTELTIDEKLCALRAEQADYRGISFDTIAGYAAHGAIVHYEATPETDIPLEPKGLLLLDSGGQYLDGTTDLTRTIALGPTTEEERTDYTLVLKGFLALMNAEFPAGTCGTQLDVLARQAMWKRGINYLHGTGHGVGSYLCVHEGPHQIRMNHMPTLLKAGMTVTDEPGIYKAGKHGIRTENTLLIVPAQETAFGPFFRFEPLTLCPIDKAPIEREMLTAEEVEWLNSYHRTVYEKLSPRLDAETREWLKEACSALE
ncbi:MAG: aminopeptidase P family protein [Bacteroides sp.]